MLRVGGLDWGQPPEFIFGAKPDKFRNGGGWIILGLFVGFSLETREKCKKQEVFS